jgi:hypothetical protein
MAYLTAGQPEFERQVQQQQTRKNNGESHGGVHAMSLGLFIFPFRDGGQCHP